jgi:leader peptidase (prepilin peptidase) / N-methyltransferase
LLDPALQPLVMIFTFILGLCIGSFLNVMGLRFLADECITVPPSHCPKCKAKIQPQDNIPVISWILLGGQCRNCKESISVQYPLIELATGVLFCTVVWFFGISWQSLFLLFLVCNLIVIFITDLRESLIFQINSLSLVPVGLIYSGLNLGGIPGSVKFDLGAMVIHVPEAIISAIIAIVISIVFFEGIILLSLIFFGTEGFGHGDTHLMMGAGAFLGWPLTVLALVLGFIAQTIPAVPMLVIQWIRNKQYVSLISGAVALVGGTAPLLLMNAGLPLQVRTTVSLLCMLMSVVALIVFLRQVKSSQNFTYLPLGPALVIGILISLFWGNQILAYYEHYIHVSAPH